MKYLNLVLTIIAAGLFLVLFQAFRITVTLNEISQGKERLIDAQKSACASNAHLESALLGLKEEIFKASDKFGTMATSSAELKDTISGLKQEIGKVNEKMGNK